MLYTYAMDVQKIFINGSQKNGQNPAKRIPATCGGPPSYQLIMILLTPERHD
jgi:hypothetical protein